MMSGSKKLKSAARKLLHTCGSSSFRRSHLQTPSVLPSATVVTCSTNNSPDSSKVNPDDITINAQNTDPTSSSKPMCAICLEALNYSACTIPGQAIFTAQCSHAFHFDCITSNVRHGGVTCPICRAQWTHLPRNLKIPPCTSLYGNQTDDPVLQVLDDSIATFRLHRRSVLRSVHYDDDDAIEPGHSVNHPRLHLSIISGPISHPSFNPYLHQRTGHLCGSSTQRHVNSSPSLTPEPAYRACLSVRLANQPAMDLVLVACPNGPHLRLIKQSMALVVFSLRPIDRLAVVTYSSSAARVFSLRRMTSYGKRSALQVIDRLFYMGQADPVEGLKKGIKVLGDRAYENPQSCILHLSDNPTRLYNGFDMESVTQIHRFHVGHSFGTSKGLVMHEFEEFLGRVLGDKICDIQLRIRGDGRIARLGELRGREERRIPLNISEAGKVCVEYSYIEDGLRESGEMMVGSSEKHETDDYNGSDVGSDPYMARSWARHLHGYRF